MDAFFSRTPKASPVGPQAGEVTADEPTPATAEQLLDGSSNANAGGNSNANVGGSNGGSSGERSNNGGSSSSGGGNGGGVSGSNNSGGVNKGRSSSSNSGFGDWADPKGWFGQRVTGQYFCACWLQYALQTGRWELQADAMASITSNIISLDHVMEPAKRVNGCSKALLLVCDKMGRVMAFFGTSTTGLQELEPELKLIYEERYKANDLQVRCVTTIDSA
jgi:hypothetical protein